MSTKPRVVIAMSGGVDSSVAAALLVEQGYDVVGLMLRLWGELSQGEASLNRCCSAGAVDDARRVADDLDIPFYLVNIERPFKQKVVDPWIDAFRQGMTPNPCLSCNRNVRLDILLNHALSLGAQYLATGHYARVRRSEDGAYQLLKGADPRKDQSYVLHMARQAQLAHLMFPVGEYTKPQVREMATARGISVAQKAESQEICFVVDDDYRRFLRDWAPEILQPGPIMDRHGNVLGQHQGLPNYTVGQRKGLGIAAPEPLYVLEVDPERNAVVVGTLAELGSRELWAEQVSWVSGRPPVQPLKVQAKIRYKAREMPAVVQATGPGTSHVVFDEMLRDITPGQGIVFYEGEVCLGGGIICRSPQTIGAKSGSLAA